MHSHGHAQSRTGGVLRWSLAATFVFVAIEIVAGLKAGSLALLSDAGHNFTDALALLLAWIAIYFQGMPADEVKTYGYQRAGVLSAFVNALTLVCLSLWIFYESVKRLQDPLPVHEDTMLAVAVLGLILNAGIMLALRSASRHDLNVRGAFVHMLGDALGSIAIIGGAIVIRLTGWMRVDPLLSIAIGGLVIWTAWDIVRESLNILLEGLPRGITLDAVAGSMRSVEGVLDIHDLHIWSLGSNSHALSCHVLIDDVPPSSSDAILRRLNSMLEDGYKISHTTMQFEHVSCVVSGNGCVIPADCREAHRHE